LIWVCQLVFFVGSQWFQNDAQTNHRLERLIAGDDVYRLGTQRHVSVMVTTISGNKHERNIGVMFFLFFSGFGMCNSCKVSLPKLSQQMSKCKMSIEKHVFGCFW
jgi:hypothetical protein